LHRLGVKTGEISLKKKKNGRWAYQSIALPAENSEGKKGNKFFCIITIQDTKKRKQKSGDVGVPTYIIGGKKRKPEQALVPRNGTDNALEFKLTRLMNNFGGLGKKGEGSRINNTRFGPCGGRKREAEHKYADRSWKQRVAAPGIGNFT